MPKDISAMELSFQAALLRKNTTRYQTKIRRYGIARSVKI
jgi:hypothetical protein